MSTLRELADKYRQMPNGGARLTLSRPDGKSWYVGDGLVVKAEFPTRNQAIFALQRAGFKEIERGVFKLMPSNEEVIESQACRIRDLISENQVLLKACKEALPWIGKMIADKGHLNSVAPNAAIGAMERLEAAITRVERGGL